MKLSLPEQKLLLVLARFAINNEVKGITNTVLSLYCGWKNTSHISKYLTRLRKRKLIYYNLVKNQNDSRRYKPNHIKFIGSFKPNLKKIDNKDYIKIQYKLLDLGVIAKWNSAQLKIYMHLIRFAKIIESDFIGGMMDSNEAKKSFFLKSNTPSIYKLSQELKINRQTIKNLYEKNTFTTGDGFILVNNMILFINYYLLNQINNLYGDDNPILSYIEEIHEMIEFHNIEYKLEKSNIISDVFKL